MLLLLLLLLLQGQTVVTYRFLFGPISRTYNLFARRCSFASTTTRSTSRWRNWRLSSGSSTTVTSTRWAPATQRNAKQSKSARRRDKRADPSVTLRGCCKRLNAVVLQFIVSPRSQENVPSIFLFPLLFVLSARFVVVFSLSPPPPSPLYLSISLFL